MEDRENATSDQLGLLSPPWQCWDHSLHPSLDSCCRRIKLSVPPLTAPFDFTCMWLRTLP